MRRNVIGVLGAAICLGLAAGAGWLVRGAAPEGVVDIVRAARAAVVTLEVADDRRGDAACRGRSNYGAGFFIDPSGLIVTNYHVVSGGDVTVRLADGTSVPGRFVAGDPRTDIALVRIDVDRALPTLRLAANVPELGARVIAVGTPLGLAGSVTAGVVSGRERAYDQVDPVGYLQHDAAINPGNSGGPLLNDAGEVIGINTAIPDETLYNIGISLAVPAPQVRAVVDDLLRHGYVRRAWLGISVQQVDGDLATALGRPGERAVIVIGVEPGSPAAAAGLREGDILASGNGAALATIRDFGRLIEAAGPGSALSFAVERDGATLTVAVRSAVSPPDPAAGTRPAARTQCREKDLGDASAAANASDRPASPGFLLDAEIITRGGTADRPEDGIGARIAEVDEASLAARAGLAAGDRILAVGATSVANGEEALRALRAALAPGSTGVLALLVERAGVGRSYVTLPLAAGGAGRVGNAGSRFTGPY